MVLVVMSVVMVVTFAVSLLLGRAVLGLVLWSTGLSGVRPSVEARQEA